MKRITRKIFRFVQKILLFVLLTLLYAVGFGMARLFLAAAAFRPRKNPETFWRDVRDSAAGMKECKEQS